MSSTPYSYSGHHPSVLTSHNTRKASDSCPYLLPHLRTLLESTTARPFRILDVGCGPGSITLDLARIVAPYGGEVVGIEPAGSGEDALVKARDNAREQGVGNVTFVVGSVLDLDLDALGMFEVTHAHQVLQHLSDPLTAVKEMKRATKRGGLVALREGEVSSVIIHPVSPVLDKFNSSWITLAELNGAHPKAGRALIQYCQDAGFKRDHDFIEISIGNMSYHSEADVKWWAGIWEQRVLQTGFAKGYLDRGLGAQSDLEDMATAWREWGEKSTEGAWYALLCAQVVCKVA